MNLKIHIFVVMTVLCLFSCTRRGSGGYSTSLLMLEDSLNAMPEKYLNRIIDIDTASLNKADKALYYALLVQAKALVPDTPLQLSNQSDEALSYFLGQKDSARLCSLYFSLGKVYADNYAFFRANSSYNQAEKYVRNDSRMLFSIKLGEASIYHFKMMYRMEEECLQQALHIAVLLKDSVLTAEALHELAKLHLTENNYSESDNYLRRALQLLPSRKSALRAEYYKDLGKIYLAMNKLDSALYYVDIALQNDSSFNFKLSCNLIQGNIFLKMHRLNDAERILMQDIDKLPLNWKRDTYYKMSLLKDAEKDYQTAFLYAKKSIGCRDSLDMNSKIGYISNLNAFQEHDRQQQRIVRINMELAEQKLAYYKLAVSLFLILGVGILIVYRVKRAKRKIEVTLKEKEEIMVDLQNSRCEAEHRYQQEKDDREALEVESLNQRTEYYKRLNALTVPILIKSQNSQGFMHLKKEDWDIIVQNTNACFNNFTYRLKEAFPQLTSEEVHFICLLKMELPLSLLSDVYHIAKGSISRKKMRLKEKMKIENMTLDDFIRQF